MCVFVCVLHHLAVSVTSVKDEAACCEVTCTHTYSAAPLAMLECIRVFLGWKEKGGGSDLDRFCKDGRPLREENKHRYKRLVWFNRQDEV